MDRGGVDASLESGCVPWSLDMRCVKCRRAFKCELLSTRVI